MMPSIMFYQGGQDTFDKFLTKFPIGLHVILQLQTKNSKLAQNYFNSLTPLWKLVKMSFVFKLHGNTYKMYAINGRTSGVLPSGVAKLSWAIPAPCVLFEIG